MKTVATRIGEQADSCFHWPCVSIVLISESKLLLCREQAFVFTSPWLIDHKLMSLLQRKYVFRVVHVHESGGVCWKQYKLWAV